MRYLKLLAAFILVTSSLGLAACTGGDLSGTAGDIPEPKNPSEPGDEPVAPAEPGGGGSAVEPGGSTSPGKPGTGVDLDLEAYLAQKVNTRIDLKQIEKDCDACVPEAVELFEKIEDLCATDADACTAEYQVFVTKERTEAQVRNGQNLVGFPTGEQLLTAIDAVEAVEPGSGDEPVEPAAGLPSKESVDAVANIVDSLGGTGVAESTWADIVTAASAAPDGAEKVAEVTEAFEKIAGGEIKVDGCDAACRAIIEGLVDGDAAPIADIGDALAVLAEASR